VALVTALLVIGIACGIAAWFVVREAGRMAAEPPPPVFDPEEAYEWVVEHLPEVVAATLTPDDVHRILGFQLEYFQRKGVTGNGSAGTLPKTTDASPEPIGPDAAHLRAQDRFIKAGGKLMPSWRRNSPTSGPSAPSDLRPASLPAGSNPREDRLQ